MCVCVCLDVLGYIDGGKERGQELEKKGGRWRKGLERGRNDGEVYMEGGKRIKDVRGLS